MDQGKQVMKAISLWQPWASLVVCGAKKIETRSWPTKVRGTVAIHAAKRPFNTSSYLDRELHPFANALGLPDIYSFNKLPLGCILGTVEIIEVYPIVSQTNIDGRPLEAAFYDDDVRVSVTGNELLFGGYTPGRYAWILDNPVMFDKPIPAIGRQGFWNWEVPDEINLV